MALQDLISANFLLIYIGIVYQTGDAANLLI